jgi:hypothetical protein
LHARHDLFDGGDDRFEHPVVEHRVVRKHEKTGAAGLGFPHAETTADSFSAGRS